MVNTRDQQKAKGKTPIVLYIDQDLHKKLKATCALKGESMTDRMTILIKDYFRNDEN